MARIIAYPINSSPKGADLLLGTKTPAYLSDEKPITTNITIGAVAAFANTYNLGYTVYTALLNQTGAAAPVATILQNTTSGTLTWTRQSAGNYTVTASTALFTVNKTIVFGNYGNAGAGLTQDFDWNRTSDTTITLIVRADSKLANGSFEIRIYS